MSCFVFSILTFSELPLLTTGKVDSSVLLPTSGVLELLCSTQLLDEFPSSHSKVVMTEKQCTCRCLYCCYCCNNKTSCLQIFNSDTGILQVEAYQGFKTFYGHHHNITVNKINIMSVYPKITMDIFGFA